MEELLFAVVPRTGIPIGFFDKNDATKACESMTRFHPEKGPWEIIAVDDLVPMHDGNGTMVTSRFWN